MCPSIVSDLVKSPKPDFCFGQDGSMRGGVSNQSEIPTHNHDHKASTPNQQRANQQRGHRGRLALIRYYRYISGSYNNTQLQLINSTSAVDHVLPLNLKSSSWRKPSHGVQPNTTKHEHSPTSHSPINPSMHFLHTEDGTSWTAAAADRGSRIE
jgi:hypothetical protein